MTENPFIDWRGLNDRALCATIGTFIRHHRLNQNKSQDEVATSAGISRSTVSMLERGEGVTLDTLLRILRVLDLLYVMQTFAVENEISPIAYAKLQKKKKQRARKGTSPESEIEESEW